MSKEKFDRSKPHVNVGSIGNEFFEATKEAVKKVIEENLFLDSKELWGVVQMTFPGISKTCLKEAVRELSEGK